MTQLKFQNFGKKYFDMFRWKNLSYLKHGNIKLLRNCKHIEDQIMLKYNLTEKSETQTKETRGSLWKPALKMTRS